MKKWLLLLLPVLAACNGTPPEGTALSDISDADSSDSLVYYLGETRAAEYWRLANEDTMMKSRENRMLYLKGLQDGLKAVKENKGAYNDGLRDGINLALWLYKFNAEYSVELDKKILYGAVAYGLRNDTVFDEIAAQRHYYSFLERAEKQRRDRELLEAQATLPKVARRLGMWKLADNLYCKVDKQGNEEHPQKGDMVYVAIDYKRENGEDLGLPSPEQLEVGNPAMPEVMTRAFLSLSKGETATFATMATALFDNRSSLIGLRGSEVILIKITLQDIIGKSVKVPADSLIHPMLVIPDSARRKAAPAHPQRRDSSDQRGRRGN